MTGRAYRSRIYDNYLLWRDELVGSEGMPCLRPRAPYLKKLIREHFPLSRDASVLDLGCGDGALLHFAREAGYTNLRGVDGSPQQVAAAKSLGIVGVEAGDLREVLESEPDSSFDLVVTFDVIEHFEKDELLRIVDHVYRVLKSGGGWIIHVPNGESPFFGRIRYGDLTHELAFTRKSLTQLLLSSGFTSVRCFEDAPVVHNVKSALRWVLWKAFRNVLRLYIGAETGDISRETIFSQNFLAVATKL